MAMNFSNFAASFEDIDYSDLSSWPAFLKSLVSLSIGVGILVAMFFLFYQPKMEIIEIAKRKEMNLRKEFISKQKLAVNLPAYKKQMVEIKQRFDKVLTQLPEASEVPALLTDISEAGIEQGLVFRNFKPLAKEQKNFYVRLPIKIQASGTYHQLAGFISAIANFQRVVTVGNLDIARAGKKNRGIDPKVTPLVFSANIYTYYYSAKANPSDKNKGAVKRVKQ
jgi:type IV pilus assembly protein PilO